MLPHPPYQALQPQKGCKTTFNCVVPAGHSVRGMPLRSTGLPSLPGRVQEIPLNAGALRGMVPPQAGRRRGRWAAREKAPVTARPNPPPISPCSLRRAPPFRCERSEQAEPPAITPNRAPHIANRKSQKKGPPSGRPLVYRNKCCCLLIHNGLQDKLQSKTWFDNGTVTMETDGYGSGIRRIRSNCSGTTIGGALVFGY